MTKNPWRRTRLHWDGHAYNLQRNENIYFEHHIIKFSVKPTEQEKTPLGNKPTCDGWIIIQKDGVVLSAHWIFSIIHSFSESLGHTAARPLNHSVTRSLGHFSRSLGHLVNRSFDHSVSPSVLPSVPSPVRPSGWPSVSQSVNHSVRQSILNQLVTLSLLLWN